MSVKHGLQGTALLKVQSRKSQRSFRSLVLQCQRFSQYLLGVESRLRCDLSFW